MLTLARKAIWSAKKYRHDIARNVISQQFNSTNDVFPSLAVLNTVPVNTQDLSIGVTIEFMARALVVRFELYINIVC